MLLGDVFEMLPKGIIFQCRGAAPQLDDFFVRGDFCPPLTVKILASFTAGENRSKVGRQ